MSDVKLLKIIMVLNLKFSFNLYMSDVKLKKVIKDFVVFAARFNLYMSDVKHYKEIILQIKEGFQSLYE